MQTFYFETKDYIPILPNLSFKSFEGQVSILFKGEEYLVTQELELNIDYFRTLGMMNKSNQIDDSMLDELT